MRPPPGGGGRWRFPAAGAQRIARFNEAAARRRRKVGHAITLVSSIVTCFNEAAARRRRKVLTPSGHRGDHPRFNEAAARRRRKATTQALRHQCGSGFNEAAARRRRKAAECCSHCPPVAALQ